MNSISKMAPQAGALDRTMAMGKGVIVLTYGCNLKCTFCYAAAEVFDKPGTMSLAEARASVDFLASLGIETYTLLGGEPTLYKHLIEIVRYSHKRGVAPWMVTNGVAMSDPQYGQRLIDAGLKGGCVSFHGLKPADHDALTRKIGSHEAAMKAVANAVERDWPLYPMLTVMEYNFDHTLEIVDSFRALGCKTIYVNYGVPNVAKKLDTGVDASPRALARLSQDLFYRQQDLGVRFIFNREKNKVPLCLFDHATLAEMFEDNVIGTGCEAVKGNTVVIEPGGSVLGCSHWVEHPLINIYKDYDKLELYSSDEFWALWSQGEPLAFRQSLDVYPFIECDGCGWRAEGKCMGGCKVWQNADVIPRGGMSYRDFY